MTQGELSLYIIKLVLGGMAAFLAILLWSKTRDAAWMSLVAGAVVSYAGIVYSMLEDMGITFVKDVLVLGMPLTKIIFAVLPSVFFILSFILMLLRHREK